MGHLDQFFQRLDHPEKVRVLDQDGRGVAVESACQGVTVGFAGVPVEGDGDDAQADPRQVGGNHLPILRVHRLADHHRPAPRAQARGHQGGLGQRRGAIVQRRVGHLHAEQARHHGLEFEDRLQRALAHLRLIRGVRRVQLAAEQEVRYYRRRVVMVGAGPQEAAMGVERAVGRGQAPEQRRHLRLAHSLRQVEPREPVRVRHVGEQLLDRCDADGLQHRGQLRLGVRGVAHPFYGRSWR